MNISWIIDRDCIPHTDNDGENLREVGPTWSSWHAWRGWNTDNVLVYDFQSSQDLVKRGYHKRCNLFIPQELFSRIGRPAEAKLYKGKFDEEFDRQEEVMAMMLAAAQSDILLLLGFDLAEINEKDAYKQHRNRNYLNAVKRVCLTYPDRQWVLVDPVSEPDKRFKELTNMVVDNRENVLKLLLS